MRTAYVFIRQERIPSVAQSVSLKEREKAELNKWQVNGYDHCVVTGPSRSGGRANITCLSPGEAASVAMAMSARNSEAPVWMRYSRKQQVQELVHAFVDAVKDLVPAVSHAWRHLVQFGTLVETMASFSIWGSPHIK